MAKLKKKQEESLINLNVLSKMLKSVFDALLIYIRDTSKKLMKRFNKYLKKMKKKLNI